MEYLFVPIIVVASYLAGELWKLVFSKKEEMHRFIPILCTICGGILGIAMFFTAPDLLPGAQNVWVALELGFASGASATGMDQLVRQLLKKATKGGSDDENVER